MNLKSIKFLFFRTESVLLSWYRALQSWYNLQFYKAVTHSMDLAFDSFNQTSRYNLQMKSEWFHYDLNDCTALSWYRSERHVRSLLWWYRSERHVKFLIPTRPSWHSRGWCERRILWKLSWWLIHVGITTFFVNFVASDSCPLSFFACGVDGNWVHAWHSTTDCKVRLAFLWHMYVVKLNPNDVKIKLFTNSCFRKNRTPFLPGI